MAIEQDNDDLQTPAGGKGLEVKAAAENDAELDMKFGL